MAFSEHSITSLTQIPELVGTFATTIGWSSVSATKFKHPNFNGAGPGGYTFGLTATATTLTVGFDEITNTAFIRAPILATEAAPTVGVNQAPTRVFLIGRLLPQPYIAIVVEFGFNLYRHMYLGFMEKIGPYTGGEVITASNGPGITYNGDLSIHMSAYVSHLFGANQTGIVAAQSGGVRVQHAGNANAFRMFRRAGNHATGTLDGTLNGTEALGGPRDGWNDHFLARARNPISGVNVLTPINMLISQIVGGSAYVAPIGRPSGVRLIHLANLEPQSRIEIGAEVWRCFAAFSRKDDVLMYRPGNTGIRYRLAESSYHLGYAYRES